MRTRITTLAIALATCLALAAFGCAEDADTDGSDEGYVNDGPVNVNGSCNVQPFDCDDLGETKSEQNAGCCFGYVKYWCGNAGDEWVLKSKDCETCAPQNSGESVYCKAHVTSGDNPGSHPPETSRW